MRSLEWAASIAVSWLWGLGLFFSWHFTALYGPVGLALFAIPNALGLLLFGLVTARLAQRQRLRIWIEDAHRRYPHVFFSYQLIAIALTLFAFAKYFLIPIGVSAPFFVAIALLFLACVLADRSTLAKLARLHAFVLLVLAVSFAVLVYDWPAGSTTSVGTAAHDWSFFAFVVPLAGGLLFGPWFDLQQWQRAVAIDEESRPIAGTFALGSGLFLLLLVANGALAMWSGVDGTAAAPGTFDPYLHAEAGVSAFAAAYGSVVFKAALAVWVIGTVFTTFDSSRLAMQWFEATTIGKSESLLVGLLPERARSLTVPFYGLCVFVAGLGLVVEVDLEYFMIFYASLFLAYSAALVREAVSGKSFAGQSSVFALGIASLCLLAAGYLTDQPIWMAIAPLIALASYWLVGDPVPAIGSTPSPREDSVVALDRVSAPPAHREILVETDRPPEVPALSSRTNAAGDAPPAAASQGWFEDKWFQIHIMSTYADTNSVGNVYFASYVEWVGKTRELFFRSCMPSFDLKETQFYILTRNFQHKFVREMREFDEMSCRLRIKRLNRKFVELQHEIRDNTSQLVGEGSQTLMFVDSSNYRLIDIPEGVLSAFRPYY